MSKFSSRKFWTMIGCICLFSLLLVFGHLTSEDYKIMIMVILPAYFAANVVEKKRVAD